MLLFLELGGEETVALTSDNNGPHKHFVLSATRVTSSLPTATTQVGYSTNGGLGNEDAQLKECD